MGIVLNSVIIHTPQQATNQLVEQERWLQAELKHARQHGAQHVVIFAHHPWFLKTADEPDEYFNIPGERRARYLGLVPRGGRQVPLLRSLSPRRSLPAMPALKPSPPARWASPWARASPACASSSCETADLEHRFYHFGELPNRIDLGARIP